MTDHTITLTEYAPKGETTTAVIDVRLATGENFTGPIVCGFYPGGDDPEIWIEQEGRRVQFPASALATIHKQLKRAEKLAHETTP